MLFYRLKTFWKHLKWAWFMWRSEGRGQCCFYITEAPPAFFGLVQITLYVGEDINDPRASFIRKPFYMKPEQAEVFARDLMFTADKVRRQTAETQVH